MNILNNPLKYANKDALHNPIQIILYSSAYPIAILFKKVNISPNQVTVVSTLFSVFAFVSLTKYNLLLFCTFWGISYILDYADGTLARLSNKIGKSALRLDHAFDNLKIIMLFLGFGIYYNRKEIWILTFLSSTIFLFYSLLNHDLCNNLKLSKLLSEDNHEGKELKKAGKLKFIKRYLLRNFIVLKYLYIFIFGTFYILNGHTLVIFFFIPLSYEYSIYLFIYFITICVIHSYHRAVALSQLKKYRS